MLEVHNLTKRYGAFTAVDSLTFRMREGEIFGFLGPNGAGKTTTMRMLCCLIAKSEGEAKVGGYDIDDPAASLTIRKMIGFVPDNVGLYGDLSAYDNLQFYGRLYDCPEPLRSQNIEYFLKLLGLWGKRNQPVESFSKGMKQKVAVARALIHNPKILFLDELTANLDPESAKVVIYFILQLRDSGKTIFLNTHNLDEAQRICDRIGIIKTRLLAINTPEELKKSIWGNRTVIQLAEITAAVLAALQELKPEQFVVEDRQITVEVTDPLIENPVLINSLTAAGGRIQFVTGFNPALEETYLKIMEEAK